MEDKEKEINAEKVLKELDGKKSKKNDGQNQQLKNIFIAIAIFIALIIILMFLGPSKSFEYKGLKFDTIREGELVLYNTSLPLYTDTGKNNLNFTFYLRNDPRKLDKIPFNGTPTFKEDIIINSDQDYNCDGDGIIAVANLKQLYEQVLGGTMSKENGTCDNFGRYVYLNLMEGNETKIEQTGFTCYNLVINNCEVLEVTEKLMLDIFVKRNEQIIKKYG